MGISTLPPTTVGAIGAAQALNDPAAVVKELIDNALDARATSIFIEISNNALDSIQVRDNGHGIPGGDRALVARPNCTSKIRDEEELRSIGGRSLGFRGQALASLAEMSSSLTITTRVEGEQVAVALKIDRQGEIAGRQSSGLPPGTTVKVLDFLKDHPVRRQVALKNSEQSLAKMKHCLQSYAFARPHVRLSLKILKSRGNKGDWTYAPKSGGNVEDAVSKLLGSACASQCIWSVVENQECTLRAFLPKPGADLAKVSHVGAFISVDGRPVSATRGTIKLIVKTFRNSLKAANAECSGLKDSFFYLDISCQPGSYDANVEPAKDEVLFESPNVILETAKQLFAAAYPTANEAVPTKGAPEHVSIDSHKIDMPLEQDDFFTSLEGQYHDNVANVRQQSPLDLVSDGVIEELINSEKQDQSPACITRPSFRHNMWGCDEEDLDLFDAPPSRDHADSEELRRAEKDVTLSNPWIKAKMNASLRRRGEQLDSSSENDPPYWDKAAAATPFHSGILPIDVNRAGLPTPRLSSPGLLPLVYQPQFVPSTPSTSQFRVPIDSITPQGTSTEFYDSNNSYARTVGDFTSSREASQIPPGTPLASIPDISSKRTKDPRKRTRQTQVNKPFKPPAVKDGPGEQVWFDHLENRNQLKLRQRTTKQDRRANKVSLVSRGELGDLSEDPHPLTPPVQNRDMRDFLTRGKLPAGEDVESLLEARDRAQQNALVEVGKRRMALEDDDENANPIEGARSMATSDQVDVVGHADQPAQTMRKNHRPSKRRKTSEDQALREVDGNGEYVVKNCEEHRGTAFVDQPACLRQRTTDRNKARRSKSSRLPLERIPMGKGTHNATLSVHISSDAIRRLASGLNQEQNQLLFNGTGTEAPEHSENTFESLDINKLTQELYVLLRDRVSQGEMVQDLKVLVHDAMKEHHQRFAIDGTA